MGKKFTGWKIAFDIYPALYFKKSLIKPGVIWVVSLIVFFCFSETDSLKMLGWLADFIKSAFPSILGFILTGHALIVGFSGSDFILHLAKERKDSKTTLLQDTNTTFTIVIASMVLNLLIGTIVGFLLKVDLPCWNYELARISNAIVFSVGLFVFYYSVCSLFDVVISIFNLGQASNVIAQGKIKKMEENAKANEDGAKAKRLIDYFRDLFR